MSLNVPKAPRKLDYAKDLKVLKIFTYVDAKEISGSSQRIYAKLFRKTMKSTQYLSKRVLELTRQSKSFNYSIKLLE